MANNNSVLEQLKSFLNELFQFDSQDLDFGVYKILHFKRKEIKDFIDKLLVEKVREQLQTLTSEESKIAQQQLKDLEKDEFITGWISATEEERKVGEKMAGSKVAEYRRVKTLVDEVRVAEGTENHIYNHLTLFFSRYYDKGDFISKRRFGKNEKYMVPYNGEETHFYWANHDQYYIKSSESFQQYAFKIPTPQDNMVVNFKLTSAHVEQGNVKADEPNYFILSEKEAEIGEKETNFFFEYRPLTDDEKKTFKGNNKQDVLDERVFEALKDKYSREVNLVKLWETGTDDKPLLLKKLNHYTRKNKYDFFIHKNLKGFLQRELDYYIKSELINVDDLYVSEVDSYFNRLKHNVKTIKVFKNIADTIIEFVSQIEDFQKKLWEKKKFVLSTEWVITIDRLVDYTGEEAAKPILEEVIKNEKQVAEWKALFGEENVPEKLSLETLKADLHSWRKLPIDTVHFSKEFKIELLNELSEKIELEEKADGLIINSDNQHGLALFEAKFSDLIKLIYIDPPYNTGEDGFIYKDAYKHSTWASMVHDRLIISRDLLVNDGALFCSIDEKEHKNLAHILDKNFGESNFISDIVWAAGRKNDSKLISISHEYMRVYAKNKESLINNNVLWHQKKKGLNEIYKTSERLKKKYKDDFETITIELKKWYRELPDSHPAKAHKHYSHVDSVGVYFPSDISWPGGGGPKYEVLHPMTGKPVKNPSRGWMTSEPDKMKEWIQKDLVHFGEDENSVPCIKSYLKEKEYQAPYSVFYQDGRAATKRLRHLLVNSDFGYPKDETVIADCEEMLTNKNDTILDFFAGSGTTFHSTQILNKQDSGFRKTILIEQGTYFYSSIIPRIKKIAYTFHWKDGKPKNGSMNGLGVFFKYQRLEQYEEALENIAFTADTDAQQQALEFDQYIPKYMLEFETKNSQTLVNTEAMKDPWDYKLKVWDGFTYDTEQAVDLVETFNYLIGLHMQKCITKDFNGIKYQFIYGHNNANKNILVVWRSVKDWEIEDYTKDREVLTKELENFSFDVLYVNEQAHLPEKYTYQPIEEVFKNKMLP